MAEHLWFKPYLPMSKQTLISPGVPNAQIIKTNRSLLQKKKDGMEERKITMVDRKEEDINTKSLS